MPLVLVLADDFSGAAEVGQQFAAHGLAAQITLTTAHAHHGGSPTPGAEVAVVDTHSRGLAAPAAAEAVQTALEETDTAREALVFKKTDSLWRGNIGAEIAALTGLGYHVVLAGALPALERTVVGARPLAGDRPLRASGLWAAESILPPEDLHELFAADTELRFVGLDDVRSADLAGRLARSLSGSTPAVVVVDGETDADVAAVVEALAPLGFLVGGHPVALAGTGQLGGHLARHLAHGSAPTTHSPADPALPAGPSFPPGSAPHHRPVLAVVGSASPTARRQLDHLAAEGFHVVAIGPAPEDQSLAASRIRTALDRGHPVAVTVADGAVDPAISAVLVTHLAGIASESLQGLQADLILTGGETAREVLDALGITSLVPREAVQHGAVVSTADDGRLVATKPGSFGDPLVLVQLYRSIQAFYSIPRASTPAH
ncbi:four-carbon acid sugar kinase family protein [Sinomonas sp. ASV486]|uniref:four-carbon acid sugar kinase family protein n=1 Tax=Sinomonas sp. ASV486 TaxID=3051170 RepID=UPI0027DDE9A1|nr:four-carbon acid sugar kinase family protein [Sinomonas sp. ASV486]MDQ4489428.1 four-carbon acid sugar kinase family protein [Sinomonas sp. ASV486]